MKFRKRPVVIDAMLYDGTNTYEVVEWMGEHTDATIGFNPGGTIVIPTLEGNMIASVGDWIIRGVQGELYPCKPDIFEATYEEVK
jgi:hypothetical protein